MNGFVYVYILETAVEPENRRYYVGLTSNLSERLARHNAGLVPHTSLHRPWSLKTAVAFRERARAAAFEQYLKSPSGRAFAKKRL